MNIYGGYKRNEPHSQALRKLITSLRKKALLTYIPLGKAKIRMGKIQSSHFFYEQGTLGGYEV